MSRTDTKALAAAIEAFEEEFPDLDWMISKEGNNVTVLKGFKVLASKFADSTERAFTLCAMHLRLEREKHRISAENTASMDAEYGPERLVR